MDSNQNLVSNDTFEDSQFIEDLKSINLINKNETKQPSTESSALQKLSESIF